MENKEFSIQVGLTLDEVLFIDALLDDEEYRLESIGTTQYEEGYPHIETLRQKLFNARLHLKHKSL